MAAFGSAPSMSMQCAAVSITLGETSVPVQNESVPPRVRATTPGSPVLTVPPMSGACERANSADSEESTSHAPLPRDRRAAVNRWRAAVFMRYSLAGRRLARDVLHRGWGFCKLISQTGP